MKKSINVPTLILKKLNRYLDFDPELSNQILYKIVWIIFCTKSGTIIFCSKINPYLIYRKYFCCALHLIPISYYHGHVALHMVCSTVIFVSYSAKNCYYIFISIPTEVTSFL